MKEGDKKITRGHIAIQKKGSDSLVYTVYNRTGSLTYCVAVY